MAYRKIGNNKYRVEIEKTVKGKRKRKTETVTTTLKGTELTAYINAVEIKLLEEINTTIVDSKSIRHMNLSELTELFITVNTHFEERTIIYYRTFIKNNIVEYFEETVIEDITHAMVKRCFKHLKKVTSETTGRKLSPKTIKHHKTVLYAVLEFAVEEGAIKENPVMGIKTPKVIRSIENKFYSPDELRIAIDLLNKHSYLEKLLMFILPIVTGMRPSEMYGLKWSKINFESEEVLINKALVRAHGVGYIYKDTKDDEARTSILTKDLITLLLEHKRNEVIKQKSIGIYDIENQFVFTNDKGSHKCESSFRKYWKNFCNKHEFRYICPYGLRHTSATLLAYANIPLINIAGHMGHSNLNTTQIYTHAVESVKENMKDTLQENTKIGLRLVK